MNDRTSTTDLSGRDLDRAVADEVLGWMILPDGTGVESAISRRKSPGEPGAGEPVETVNEPVPAFSSDLGAAQLVLDHCSKWEIEKLAGGVRGERYRAMAWAGTLMEGPGSANGTSAAEAICRAALKLVRRGDEVLDSKRPTT